MSRHLRYTDKLDKLPKTEPMRDPEGWGYNHGTWHQVDGLTPWDRVQYVLEKFTNKSFDKAFSYYCSKVPVYQQQYFLDKFRPTHYWYKPTWTVDKNGILRAPKVPKKDKTVVFKSIDHQTELLHKITHVKYAGWTDPAPRSEYEYFVTEGWEQEFSSSNDPKYKQLMAEKQQQLKAYKKLVSKNKQETADAKLTEALRLAKLKEVIDNPNPPYS